MPTNNTFDFSGAAQTANNAIFGAFSGAYNDWRQLKQQRKLTEQQMAYQKQMTEWNMQKQLEMWEKTGYVGQVEQLRKAGLNEALIYGGSGAGGQTANVESGNISTGMAPAGGNEIFGAVGMGIDMQLKRAQMQLIQEQADNVRADTENKRGVERDKTTTEIEDLKAGISNKRALRDIQEMEQAIKELEKNLLGETWMDRRDQIIANAAEAVESLRSAKVRANIDEGTEKSVIQTIQLKAIEAELINRAQKLGLVKTKAEIEKIKSDIKVNEQQIKNWIEANKQGWAKLSIEQKQQQINALVSAAGLKVDQWKNTGAKTATDLTEYYNRILDLTNQNW